MLTEQTIRKTIRRMEKICHDDNAPLTVRHIAADRCRLLDWVLGDRRACPVRYLESFIPPKGHK